MTNISNMHAKFSDKYANLHQFWPTPEKVTDCMSTVYHLKNISVGTKKYFDLQPARFDLLGQSSTVIWTLSSHECLRNGWENNCCSVLLAWSKTVLLGCHHAMCDLFKNSLHAFRHKIFLEDFDSVACLVLWQHLVTCQLPCSFKWVS